jgi:hypothetical protein
MVPVKLFSYKWRFFRFTMFEMLGTKPVNWFDAMLSVSANATRNMSEAVSC